ncbi:MAG: DUF5615 family PIN-like protein [Chloroflexi bacterium]|nr:DUF5615 family PIN-like protein [Chloroflexota bacterium]
MATGEPRLYIALYTDADITKTLAEQLRGLKYDAISAQEVGNSEILDPDQLEYAIRQRRAILSFNVGHFRMLYDQYWKDGRDHFGIIVSPQLFIGELLRRTRKVLDQVDADQMRNSFRNLSEFK